MATIETGARPHKEKGRATLTVAPTLVKTTLAAGDFQLQHIAGAARFYNDLVRDRNRWDIERRRNGLFTIGKLDRTQAENALRAALDLHRQNNALARGKRGA